MAFFKKIKLIELSELILMKKIDIIHHLRLTKMLEFDVMCVQLIVLDFTTSLEI